MIDYITKFGVSNELDIENHATRMDTNNRHYRNHNHHCSISKKTNSRIASKEQGLFTENQFY